MSRHDTFAPPTQEVATLPPAESAFWKMTPRRQGIYLRAVDEGRARAAAWLAGARREDWQPTATMIGAGSGLLLATYGFELAMNLLGFSEPWDGTGPSQDAVDALTWYDRSFRGRIDEELDEETTR